MNAKAKAKAKATGVSGFVSRSQPRGDDDDDGESHQRAARSSVVRTSNGTWAVARSRAVEELA